MADIELVIKIPERIHYGIEKGITVNGSEASQIVLDAVANGTPIPDNATNGKSDVLDKIRAEIEALNPEPTAYDVVDGNHIKDAVWEMLADVLQIIDKYKAESEK